MMGRTLLIALLVATTPALGAERSAPVNYVLRCLGCHLQDGTGLPAAGIPDFVGKVGVFTGSDEARRYLLHVPGVINSGLTDGETANLLNYIMETYAGASLPKSYMPFTAEEVALLKSQDVGNVVSYRRKLTEGERTIAITQQEISEMVGMTRESINKQLRSWATRGLVRLEHGAIVVLKPEPLQALIEAGPDDGD